ncbi:MAG: hypothetical protein KKD18_01770 [Nanoarchaeota archaeon]|nr:hypothetical protein [Nanoarchaeota archaeon]
MEREPVSKLQVVASSPVKSPAPIAVGVNSGILRYYQEGRRRGFESSVLTEQLLAAGFDKASVQNALLFLERESMKPRISPQTEKRILTRFSSPQKSEISLIKSSLEEKDEIGKAEIIEIIPYKKEEIPKKTVNYPSEEPEEYKKIENFDNLDRVKAKINLRKKGIIAG